MSPPFGELTWKNNRSIYDYDKQRVSSSSENAVQRRAVQDELYTRVKFQAQLSRLNCEFYHVS